EALPGFAENRIDLWVTLFALAVTLIAPLLFGFVPAVTSARSASLRDRSGIASRGSRSLRSTLVACEVALSVILVAGSSLLTETLHRLESVAPGFVPERAVSFNITLPDARYAKSEDIIQAVGKIEQQLGAQPGVEAAGASLVLPLQGTAWTSDATP